MTVQTEHVLQKLFSESSLDNISLDRLRQITEEYPFFTLGHYLLAKKLQRINASEFDEQSERTSLHFNEPIWLQSLLHPADKSELVISERIPEVEISQPIPIVEEQLAESPVVEETVQIVETEPEEIHQEVEVSNESPVVESTHQLADVIVEEAKDDASPIFEPYHTIDYFASQGIKVSHVIKGDDRLSQQLRSFTEWLKTMKRLPETKVEAQLDEVTQQNIQAIAAHSLDEKEIVTESMAEVLVKQRKEEEAIVIYEKLSLLNPSKRAYFAAKIEQLKGT